MRLFGVEKFQKNKQLLNAKKADYLTNRDTLYLQDWINQTFGLGKFQTLDLEFFPVVWRQNQPGEGGFFLAKNFILDYLFLVLAFVP